MNDSTNEDKAMQSNDPDSGKTPLKFPLGSFSSTSSFRWFLGMFQASMFSMVFFIAPIYMTTALFAMLFQYPSGTFAWLYAFPIILSAFLPPMASPLAIRMLAPMLDYFEYEEIHETKPINAWDEMMHNDKNYLLVCQPHGALSFVSICSAIRAPDVICGIVPSAVADAVLCTPIVKHMLGIFSLVSASKKSMIRTMSLPGVRGSVVLYVGGMAELFLSCENEELLYLKRRKGFIKLALQQGVDVIPIYLFGNTSVLSVLKLGFLSFMSRQLQVSLTYIWGKWFLPIPRDQKLLYVSGQPLGLPHIPDPTRDDIDKWHAAYCEQVTRLFNTYKERVPQYKHKVLKFV